MTRKHYREVADTIARQIQTHVGNYEKYRAQAVAELTRVLADTFKRENSAFRYDLFFAACGLDACGFLMPSDCETVGIDYGQQKGLGR